MSGYSLRYEDWLRGWREWARTRKRGKMAQFIVEKLEEGNQAQWLDIERGLFELTEWHAIAREWFGEKPRNSEEVDAPCMLRKGLPRAFPGLAEIKEKSRKEGTQYRSRVFRAPQTLMNDVLLHITNNAGLYLQNGGSTDHVSFNAPTTFPSYPTTNHGSTAIPVASTVPTYFGGAVVGQDYINSPTATTLDSIQHQQHSNSQNSDYHHQMVNSQDGGHRYLNQQTSYTSEDIDMYVQRITDNGINGTTTGGAACYRPPSGSSSSYNCTPPASVGMLGVPSPGSGYHQVKEEMNSPPSSDPPAYGTSPASAHSLRISPEPSMMGPSYPPSVQQQAVMSGPEMSPVTHASTSPAIPVEPELMKVKINPSSSPLEGGDQMVLLFYNPLPLGNKMVAFCSQKNQDLAYAQEAFQENMMALVCQIPEYPYPEQVELRVYNYNQVIARTNFVFYQRTVHMPPPSDMILQILSSQLQSHFPGGGSNGMGGSNEGRANGSGDQMTGYGGYIPNSMYQLLLVACKLGCEPLVHCLLSSPIMEELTQDQIKEAYECSLSNGHGSLSDFLRELEDLHQMTPIAPPMARFITRDGTTPTEQKHVPGYYDLLDELQRGGETPQARAETVLTQLLKAIKDRLDHQGGADHQDRPDHQGEEEETNQDPTPPPNDVTTPIIEITPNLDDLTVQMGSTSLSPRRRLSSSANKLKRQTNSISDEDDELRPTDSSLKSPVPMHSRESWAEVDDIVPDLVSHRKKHPFTQQSDADSAIDSFDEDSYMYPYVSSEVQRRRSSLLLPAEMFGQHNDSILIRLSPDVGVEVANSLEWEGCIAVTEDYPPNSQEKKILCKGDRIVQVGDRLVRGMTAVEFSEFFQVEATAGTVIKVLPSVPVSNPQQSIDSASITQQKVLRRMPSEPLITDTSLKSRINQLISLRSPSTERKVSLSRATTTGCYPIKIIGGKSVGVFVSDVRSDLTQQIFQGDEIIKVNGVPIRGLTLHDANQMIQTASEGLSLSVIENKAKFSHVREQVEIDSMYLRSLVDHKPNSSRDMALKKGSLLRVINMCSLPNYWVAWSIDDTTGNETQLKRILPPTIAKRHFGCDAYERVERKECAFNRPLCVSGPDSDRVAKLIAESQTGFSLCESIEQILEVCSKGFGHPVMSVNDPKSLETLKALQPMIFQTPLDAASLAQQAKFAVTSVDSFLSGESCSDYAQQVVEETQTLQHMPVWRPIGVI